jgi:hypothetical protein
MAYLPETRILLGALLTGAGGALLSPALESQLSRADRSHADPSHAVASLCWQGMHCWAGCWT